MSERLEVLIADYEATRDDDRIHTTIQATLFGLAVAVVGVILGVLTDQIGAGRGGTEAEADIPQGLLSAIPLIPLTLIAYLQMLGSQATLRSY